MPLTARGTVVGVERRVQDHDLCCVRVWREHHLLMNVVGAPSALIWQEGGGMCVMRL